MLTGEVTFWTAGSPEELTQLLSAAGQAGPMLLPQPRCLSLILLLMVPS